MFERRTKRLLAVVLLACCLSLPSISAAGPLAGAPPANDDFARAIALSGSSGRITGANVDASQQSWESGYTHRGLASIWYTWIAPAGGEVEFNTIGSDFDTLLAVYTWPDHERPLNRTAYNDDAGGARTSEVTFEATKDEKYYVAVDGYQGDTGDVILNWALASPAAAAGPRNDDLADATEIRGNEGTLRDSSAGATREGWESGHAGNAGGASIWYLWAAPENGEAAFSTDNSSFDTLLAVYTRPGGQGALNEIASNDDATGQTELTSRVTLAATKDARYYIAVDGYGGATGQAVLTWSLAPAAAAGPGNDYLINANTISGGAGEIEGSNVNATKESWEGGHAGNAGGASIWYRWRAPAGGDIVFKTAGSSFDTLLAIYTLPGSQGVPHEIASNDDSGSSRTSRVTFTATNGTWYFLAVDGYGSDTGKVVLHWEYLPVENASRPSNVDDQFESSGSPLRTVCRSGYLRAGQEYTAQGSEEKPVLLDICTSGFGRGAVNMRLVGPGGQIYGLPSSADGVFYVIPVDYPAGTYRIEATQGSLSAGYTFRMVEATGPDVVVDPNIRIHASFNVHVAGFAPSTNISLCFFKRTQCPPRKDGLGVTNRVCYSYYTSFRVWTDAHGRGTYPFHFDSGDDATRYVLEVPTPNQAPARAWFVVSE